MARCEMCGVGEVDLREDIDGSEMCEACETALLVAQTEERDGEEVAA